jgi:hypothetical protein
MPITSSSTSSSETAAGRGFLCAFIGVAAAAAATVLTCLLVIDPFGTGRLTPIRSTAMQDANPRMAHVARARDMRFDAAVIGNSTVQILSPERLTALTGLSFVQLSIPGTGPMEQAAILRHVAGRPGGGVRAIVLGLDFTWCDAGNAAKPLHPFPFWLHGPNSLTYAVNLFRMESIEAAPRRLEALLLGRRVGRPDGFWDYETIYPPGQSPLEGATGPAPRPAPPMSAARLLSSAIAGVSPSIRIIAVLPPVFTPTAPPQQTAQAREQCRAELAAALGSARPGATLVDIGIDDPLLRDPANFADTVHYRAVIAREIERRLARELSADRR